VALGLQFALDEALLLGFGGLLEAFMSLLGELQLAAQLHDPRGDLLLLQQASLLVGLQSMDY